MVDHWLVQVSGDQSDGGREATAQLLSENTKSAAYGSKTTGPRCRSYSSGIVSRNLAFASDTLDLDR
jgi:hypothetical protein